MHKTVLFLTFFVLILSGAVQAQSVIPLAERGALHAAYVVPTDDFERVDVQLIVLSGAFDDPRPAGTAHLTEHLAAFSADTVILRKPRERDIHASTQEVSTVYTNSGAPSDAEMLLRLSRAVLDPPSLPEGFSESEIDILQRETLLRERHYPRRWLRRVARQNLYETTSGRASDPIGDLPGLSLEKAYRFHEEHYVPSNVSLIVSGKIDPDRAAELVARIFGDTEPSPVPDKPWLDQKPDPARRSVEHMPSDRLSLDTVQLIKFVDFEGRTTSILNSRLQKALFFEDTRFLEGSTDWHFAKNATLELMIDVELMPGFGLEAAHRTLEETLAGLLEEPISSQEIDRARREEATYARSAKRNPQGFLRFLQNVAADGFPPLSPSVFADMLTNTTDQEVIDFAKTIVKPSATSVILAEKVD